MATDITPIYFNKERFNELTAIKRLNRRLKTGKAIRDILLDLYKKLATGRGINKIVPVSKHLFPLYLKWRKYYAPTNEEDNLNTWKKEFHTNYIDYYKPLDAIYIRIGGTALSSIAEELKLITPDTRIDIFGGALSITSFNDSVMPIERLRHFGKKLWETIQKLWPDDIKRIKYVKVGRGFELGDFKTFMKNRKIRTNENITTKDGLNSLLETTLSNNARDVFTNEEIFYLKLDEIGRQKTLFYYYSAMASYLAKGSTPFVDDHKGAEAFFTTENKERIKFRIRLENEILKNPTISESLIKRTQENLAKLLNDLERYEKYK